MKRIIIPVILSLVALCHTGHSQSFSRYFKPLTLRIDYLHIGDINNDTYVFSSYAIQGAWYKSKVNLIDTFEYGNQKVEVYDLSTGTLIYSYTYNTLMGEYRTTEAGKTTSKSFEESVMIPMPKQNAEIRFYTRKQGAEYEYKYTIFFPVKQKINTLKPQCKVVDLHIGTHYSHAYDLLIIPEGYSIEDSAKLRTDIQRGAQAILNCEPYKSNADRINIRALLSYSRVSGISREKDSTTVCNTILGTSFYTLGTERYLMLENIWRMHDLCAKTPYEAILIICNTSKYGGGGIFNWYATVSDNIYFDYVCIHELGHSIAGLADEYYTSEVSVQDFYPAGTEPAEPNITSLVNFDKKWKKMLAPDTPVPTEADENQPELLGVYEGAGYCAQGLYRPWLHCSMKEIKYNHFCPVCTQAFNKMFDFCTK